MILDEKLKCREDAFSNFQCALSFFFVLFWLVFIVLRCLTSTCKLSFDGILYIGLLILNDLQVQKRSHPNFQLNHVFEDVVSS